MPDITDYALTVMEQWFTSQGWRVDGTLLYGGTEPVDLISLANVMQMEKLFAASPEKE